MDHCTVSGWIFWTNTWKEKPGSSLTIILLSVTTILKIVLFLKEICFYPACRCLFSVLTDESTVCQSSFNCARHFGNKVNLSGLSDFIFPGCFFSALTSFMWNSYLIVTSLPQTDPTLPPLPNILSARHKILKYIVSWQISRLLVKIELMFCICKVKHIYMIYSVVRKESTIRADSFNYHTWTFGPKLFLLH